MCPEPVVPREGEGDQPSCRGCGDEFNAEALCWNCARDLETQVTGPMSADEGFCLVAAVRYALGRATYAPSSVIGWVRVSLPRTTVNDRRVMARDIRDAITRGAGIARTSAEHLPIPYAADWEQLAADLTAHHNDER